MSDAAMKVETDTTNSQLNETKSQRIKVKKWNAVAFWSYDIENDTCAMYAALLIHHTIL